MRKIMPLRIAWLLLVVTFALAQDNDPDLKPPGCEPVCHSHACRQLNGNLTDECGACDSTSQCHPAAADFDTWHERRAENASLIQQDEENNRVEL